MLADGTGRRAAPEADDQRLARVGMQGHGQDADLAVYLDHALRVVGLVQAADAQHALELRLVHTDGRLRPFFPEHLEYTRSDAITRGRDVGVGQARGHDAGQGHHEGQWQPGGHAPLQQGHCQPGDGEHPGHGHQAEARAQPRQQEEASGQ